MITSGCDEAPAPVSNSDEIPAITHIFIQPQTVQFSAENDGFKDDTTLTISVIINTVNTPDDEPPAYVLSDKETGDEVATGNFEIIDPGSGNFRIDLSITTSTTSFEQYIINAYTMSENVGGNFAQTSFRIIGISNNPPDILEINNPDEIQRPASGNQTVRFAARVTDEDGQDTIENVFMRLISQTSGEVGNSPFLLYDNGIDGGDEVENDSLYTLTFEINDQNQPDTYFLEYFAIDQGGLVSDTVTSTFSIIE